MLEPSVNTIAYQASLLADPARAAMLLCLMDGRAYTAGELARAAGIAAQTASGHFAKLREAGFITLLAQGRHRYYALNGPEIAALIEAMGVLAPQKPALRTGPKQEALRRARRCYDHLAGALGVELAQSLVDHGHVRIDNHVVQVLPQGRAFFCDLGLPPERSEPEFCRACLDWSERKPHIGGWLGRALLTHMTKKGWLRPVPQSRALAVSPEGEMALRRLSWQDPPPRHQEPESPAGSP